MIKKILDKIKEADSIIIIGHVSPDGDCLGCQFGLKEIIKDTFNKEKVYAVGEDSVTLAYMGKLDTVTDKQFRESLVIFVDLANNERAADKRIEEWRDPGNSRWETHLLSAHAQDRFHRISESSDIQFSRNGSRCANHDSVPENHIFHEKNL